LHIANIGGRGAAAQRRRAALLARKSASHASSFSGWRVSLGRRRARLRHRLAAVGIVRGAYRKRAWWRHGAAKMAEDNGGKRRNIAALMATRIK